MDSSSWFDKKKAWHSPLYISRGIRLYINFKKYCFSKISKRTGGTWHQVCINVILFSQIIKCNTFSVISRVFLVYTSTQSSEDKNVLLKDNYPLIYTIYSSLMQVQYKYT